MIITDKFKSYSLFTDEELQTSIAQDIDNMSEAERAVFFELLNNPQFEGDLTALELDRDMVSVEQWLEDDYYMGALGKSIYKPWKDDLLELFESCNYDTGVIQGGIGCQAEHTEIITENGFLAMGDLTESQKYLSYDNGKARFVQGTHAFVKGKDMLYKVRHAFGEFEATAHHKLMCADGLYRRVDQLSVGVEIVSNDMLQGDVLCALSVRQRLQGCLDDYSLDSHLCDELLHLAKGIGQVSFPSQVDAQSLSAFCRKVDGPSGPSLSHIQSWSFLQSKNDFLNLSVDRIFFDSDLAYAKISQQSYGIFQRLLQSRKSEALPRIAKALALFVRKTFPEDLDRLYVHLLDAWANHFSKHSELQYREMDGQSPSLSLHRIFVRLIAHGFVLSRSRSKAFDSKASQASEPILARLPMISQLLKRCRQSLFGKKPFSLSSLSALGLVSNSLESVSFGFSRVMSIEKTMTDWYWDLQVPMTNNYVSGGAVHHNSGKSTFSHLAVLRMLYEASCLKNPAVSYGLAPNSIIGFCSLAKSKETARRVVFEQIAAKIQESPYFKYEFAPVKDVKDEIIFPKGLAIICGSSTDTSIIGMNIFGGIIDEVNFWGKVKKTNLNFGKHWGTESKSGRLFDSVRRRMKSRYIKKGKLPGILMLISSKTTKDSFTEQFIRKEKALGNNSTFVRDRSILDMKRDSFGSSTFKVLIGTVDYPSRILIEGEDVSNLTDAMVIEIPDDFRVDFENNLEESLRDIAGVSTIAISNFISKLEKVNEMIDPSRAHPFQCPLLPDPTIWDSRKPYRINWHAICTQKDNGEWVPKLNPEAARHVHFDPAYTGDAFGMCLKAGTRILMGDLAEKPIEEIRVGDFVFDAFGDLQKVTKTFKRPYNGKINRIKVIGGKEVYITDEHPFLGIRQKSIRRSNGRRKSIVKPDNKERAYGEYRNYKPEWIEAKEIEKGDYIALPKIKDQTTDFMKSMGSVMGIPLDENLGTIVGYFLAEGSFFRKNHEKERLLVQFSFGWNALDETHVDRLKKAIEAVGIEGCVYDIKRRIEGEQSGYQLRVLDRKLGIIFHLLCGEYCDKKKLNSLFWHCSSPAFRLAAVRAYLEGDGTINAIRRGIRNGINTRVSWSLVAKTKSEDLSRFIEIECRRLGIAICRKYVMSTYRYGVIERKVGVWQNEIHGYDQLLKLFPAERLNLLGVDKPKKSSNKSFEYDQWVFHPVNEVEKVDFEGDVYNFETTGSHSYIAEMMGVHNCIAHISEMRPVQNADSEIIEYQPVFVVDFVLAIQGSKEEEVISRNIRELCYEFSNHGFHLAEFSMDTYQGREICQSLEMQGYKAGIYSVDTGISSKGENVVNTAVGRIPKAKQAYWYLRSAIYENRVKCYDYPRLLMELRKLEDTPEKVDHPEGESKDLADSLCGVVWTLFRSKNMTDLPLPSKGVTINVSSEMETLPDYAESLKHDMSIEAGSSQVIEIRQTKVYEKKKPQTLSPKYQKVSNDGSVKDLTINTDDFLVRG